MKVSIITAVYNNKEMIEKALLSVQSQNYPNIEHIVIDGASTDGTLDIINQYSSEISNIISEPDKGIYDALNKGIKNATGDIICFLHADDFFADKNVISDVVAKFEECKTDSVYGNLEYVSKNDISNIVRVWNSGSFSLKKLHNGWMPPHPAFFVKKEVYDKYGFFDDSFRIAADYDFILRVLGKYKISISISYLPKVLYKMRVGGVSNRNLKTIIQKSKEDYRAIKKNGIGGLGSLIIKNISKVPQFFRK